MTRLPDFAFDNSYHRELSGAYAQWQGDKVPAPQMLKLNVALAEELGLDPDALAGDAGALVLSGMRAPAGAAPLAMAYAGHQFGGFSPQLGDGRALLVGELIDRFGKRRDLHLKGSGRTPFSRGGDGKAALGPVLREYLVGEAMYALGVPTTRALAAVTTGEKIHRESGAKDGAVLARVASSHLRVGSFQFFAARGDTAMLQKLADYAIARHDPDLVGRDGRYLDVLKRVAERQASLVAQWVNLGFVHGVMNTDNMTISGETIDYGPCAFLDSYSPQASFSSIDQQGRYAYGNQPNIAAWNLARLAECLLGLISPEDDTAIKQATEVINAVPALYQAQWLKGLRQKLGLLREKDGDLALASGFLMTMQGQNVDYTNAFRALSDVLLGDPSPLRALYDDPAKELDAWLAAYAARSGAERASPEARAAAMQAVNPLYIPRNHKVEEALQAAEAGDMASFERLLSILQSPFTPQKGAAAYASGAPDSFGPYKTFCGT
ncbi:MAG: YdiU family protein [Roseobacter sp.]|nr:YdiU family protein [Roseobacter sp.]